MPGTVIVLGGGVAGMSAAHELCERGFTVRVFEQRGIPGGKARSVPVPGSGTAQSIGPVYVGRSPSRRADLPAEHGFRFFPGFYRHLIDTMARTPVGRGRSASDNLVDTGTTLHTWFGRAPLQFPTGLPRSPDEIVAALRDARALLGPGTGLQHGELAFFATRVWQILTSCEERRLGEYEKIGWWEFVGAASRSEAYKKLFGVGLTRSLVASRAEVASTKTIGDLYAQYLFNLIDPNQRWDRVLNAPTSDAWIDPWLRYLREQGVDYNLDARVHSINCRRGVVSSVTVERDRRLTDVRGDYYIAALPIEVMANLVTDELIRADPKLGDLIPLSRNVEWMNGIQFYLSADVRINPGHAIYLDSPWAITSVSQKQFWPDVDLSRYGDGTVRGIISVDISSWDTPGLNGKTARECTRGEIKDEVWEQLKRSLNVEGAEVLRDDQLRDWLLDADINPLVRSNAEPLLVNLIDTWHRRPDAVTAIPNLFLASDYVRTYTDLACMEGANEAARRAVNAIIKASASSAPECRLWKLQEPALLEPWRAYDRSRYQQGQPWDDRLASVALAALDLLEGAPSSVDAVVRQLLGAPSIDRLLSYLGSSELWSELLKRATASQTREDPANLLRTVVGDLVTKAASTVAPLGSRAASEPSQPRRTETPGRARFVQR